MKMKTRMFAGAMSALCLISASAVPPVCANARPPQPADRTARCGRDADATAARGGITVESLLAEMTDRDAAALYPSPARKGRLWSSADRASTAPKAPGWFANRDHSAYLGKDASAGRDENVMVDAKGPGAIVRFWATVDSKTSKGCLRIYLDGEEKPSVEGPVAEILSGGGLCGAPLSDSLPRTGSAMRRGHNLYLPVPYAKSCRVTVEGLAPADRFYYNVETVSWPEGTEVETFSSAVLARAKGAIDAANAALSRGAGDALPQDTVEETLSTDELAARSERSFSFSGPCAIRKIAVSYEEDMWKDMVAGAGDVRLEIEFDGERTVDADLARFFACGEDPRPFDTRFAAASRDGSRVTLVSRWTMPCAKSARVTLRNSSVRPFRLLSLSVARGPYCWIPGRSMRFCARQAGGDAIPARDESGMHRDFNYLSIDGTKGVCAGCAVTVANPRSAWWGEGDEKIYVDGEAFPSYLGTGSEDHYGYAWCRPDAFSHPFLAQPEGSGNLAPGVSVNMRFRTLDAICFASSLVYDMELWHWRDCKMGYNTVTWFYKP